VTNSRSATSEANANSSTVAPAPSQKQVASTATIHHQALMRWLRLVMVALGLPRWRRCSTKPTPEATSSSAVMPASSFRIRSLGMWVPGSGQGDHGGAGARQEVGLGFVANVAQRRAEAHGAGQRHRDVAPLGMPR